MTAPASEEKKPTCPECGNEIDVSVCWCGIEPNAHSFGDGHSFVPYGCDCLRDKNMKKPQTIEQSIRDWKDIAIKDGGYGQTWFDFLDEVELELTSLRAALAERTRERDEAREALERIDRGTMTTDGRATAGRAAPQHGSAADEHGGLPGVADCAEAASGTDLKSGSAHPPFSDGPRLQHDEPTPEPGPLVGPDPGREGDHQGGELPMPRLWSERVDWIASHLQEVPTAVQKEVARSLRLLQQHTGEIGRLRVQLRDIMREGGGVAEMNRLRSRVDSLRRNRKEAVRLMVKAQEDLARVKSDAAACARAVLAIEEGHNLNEHAMKTVEAARRTLAWAREEENDAV